MPNVYLTVTENNLSIEQSGEPPRIDMVIASTGGGSSETPATIKTKYESNADTNEFNDAEKSNLANQSGTNTGDQTDAEIVTAVNTNLGNTDWQTQADISGKQDTLVSGTNIKTINGETLLGSTDITISSGTEFADDTFFIYDSANTTFKLNFDTVNLTASRAIIAPDFDFDFNSWFDASGKLTTASSINIGSSSVYLRPIGTTQLNLYVQSANFFVFKHSLFSVGSGTSIGWGSVTTGATTIDTGLKRASAGVVEVTDGNTGRGQLSFKFLEKTTTERTALPNTANTTVYDTDLNKVFTNDGTTWNALF